MTASQQSRLAATSRRFLGSLLALAIGILCAEAVLQVLARTVPAVRDRLSGGHPRYVIDARLQARGDPLLTSEFDAYGFRNVERPEQADVVAIGDSQTEGAGVARDDAWPEQLGRKSGLRVYQMAFGGYGPGHYAVLSEDARALRPRAVVIGLYFGNDFADGYRWVYEQERGPELRSTDPELLARVARARARPAVKGDWDETRAFVSGLSRSPVRRWLIEELLPSIKLYLLGRRLVAAWTPPERSHRAAWQAVLSKVAGADPDLLLPFEHGPVRTVLTPRARLQAQAGDDPRIEAGVEVALASARLVQQRCAPAGVAVLLIPTKELVFEPALRASGAREPHVLTTLVERESALRSYVETRLRESGILPIDPLPALRGAIERGHNPYPEDWDGHPNALGQGAVSGAVASALSPWVGSVERAPGPPR